MKIQEAAEALLQGKKVSSANAQATIEPYMYENQPRVKVKRQKRNGQIEEMDMALSRMKQLYNLHDFSLGSYKAAPAENKQAAPAEAK